MVDKLSSPTYFEVRPDKIYLLKSKDGKNYESKINLLNLTSKYLVFKVYINKNQIFSANPSSGFILPNAGINIMIKRQKDDDETKGVDKFLIVGFQVDETITDVCLII